MDAKILSLPVISHFCLVLKDVEAEPLTQWWGTRFEQHALHLFNLCSYDMRQWDLAFIIQWLIITLQLMRFLRSSSSFTSTLTNDTGIARVMMHLADFVTEIPFIPVFTAYLLTACASLGVIAFAMFACLTAGTASIQWVFPMKVLRNIMMWFPIFYFPLIIPHLKMILSLCPRSQHPFYEDVICWSIPHAGYLIFSAIIDVLIFTIEYLITLCFYNSELPQKLSQPAYNAKCSGDADVSMLVAKTVLLTLSIAGHNSSWRHAIGALTFICGLITANHLLRTMSWWHDTALLLQIYQALILAWTGLTAVLTTSLEDAAGTEMLYFVMLPVLLVSAQMVMQWRIRVVGELREHEITSGTLVLNKIRYFTRIYCQWLAQFGDIYIEESDTQQREFALYVALVENCLEVELGRFPEHVDLHLYATQFYLSLKINRVSAYRSLRLATTAPLGIAQRFHCQMLHRELETATDRYQNTEVRHYTEFKTSREVSYQHFALTLLGSNSSFININIYIRICCQILLFFYDSTFYSSLAMYSSRTNLHCSLCVLSLSSGRR